MSANPDGTPPRGHGRRSWPEQVAVVANIAVVVVAAALLLRSEGPAARWWAERRERKTTEEGLAAAWPELIRGARTDPGAPAGKVVVEFSDYQCPACQQAHFEFAEVARAAGVGIIMRHAPNTERHPMAHGASMAAICAGRQGKFIEMNQRLFSSLDWQNAPIWEKLAADVAIPDSAAFRSCLTDDAVAAEIARDVALGRSLGVRGTPTFIGPRGMVLGVPSREGLARILGDAGAPGARRGASTVSTPDTPLPARR